MLAGNKCDLPKESHVIPLQKGKEIAAKLNCHFYSTSAKMNKNVSELFEDVTRQVIAGRSANQNTHPEKKGKSCVIS